MSRVKPRRAGYTRLSPKHQVTIPIGVVAETGVEIGTEFAVRAEPDGRIVLHPVDDLQKRRLRAIEQTAGSLKGVWRPGDLERLRDEWR
jgi:bifunctional DNA-binding transcriptional regulator/antitoxin component of YhaV-PrlF toxin-antitoxin module